jgi:predicted pyridoxine 5'-phosphate oxidase superfamily flavin-nucleotide-binding protein
MAILTDDMKHVMRVQRLGLVATVCPDGTPTLSPTGTTTVWDDDHFGCADLRSPRTMAHLQQHPAIAIKVVDECTRKGSRLQGVATVLEAGALFNDLVACDTPQGQCDAPRRLHTVVLVTVYRALPLVSPAYDRDVTEDQVRAQWEAS